LHHISKSMPQRRRAVLSIEGVEGVNISGLASACGARFGAEIKAEVGRRVRAGAS